MKRHEMQLRFFLLKLKELDKMLDNGDYPDRKGICGYLQMFFNEQELPPQPNLTAMYDALQYIKDIFTDWECFSGSYDYPVPAVLGLEDDREGAESAFEYLDVDEHWQGTDYSEARKEAVKYLIKELEKEVDYYAT